MLPTPALQFTRSSQYHDACFLIVALALCITPPVISIQRCARARSSARWAVGASWSHRYALFIRDPASSFSMREVGRVCCRSCVVFRSSLFVIYLYLRPARDPQHAHGAYFPVRCLASRSARSVYADSLCVHGISWSTSGHGESANFE